MGKVRVTATWEFTYKNTAERDAMVTLFASMMKDDPVVLLATRLYEEKHPVEVKAEAVD